MAMKVVGFEVVGLIELDWWYSWIHQVVGWICSGWIGGSWICSGSICVVVGFTVVGLVIPYIVSNCTLCPIVSCILSCSFLLYLQRHNNLYSAINVCIKKFIYKAEVLFA